MLDTGYSMLDVAIRLFRLSDTHRVSRIGDRGSFRHQQKSSHGQPAASDKRPATSKPEHKKAVLKLNTAFFKCWIEI
jgi:hypothetical protein